MTAEKVHPGARIGPIISGQCKLSTGCLQSIFHFLVSIPANGKFCILTRILNVGPFHSADGLRLEWQESLSAKISIRAMTLMVVGTWNSWTQQLRRRTEFTIMIFETLEHSNFVCLEQSLRTNSKLWVQTFWNWKLPQRILFWRCGRAKILLWTFASFLWINR